MLSDMINELEFKIWDNALYSILLHSKWLSVFCASFSGMVFIVCSACQEVSKLQFELEYKESSFLDSQQTWAERFDRWVEAELRVQGFHFFSFFLHLHRFIGIFISAPLVLFTLVLLYHLHKFFIFPLRSSIIPVLIRCR